MISIISAIGENNEIGKGNALLWDLPRDMKHFRETTKGCTVIMGRKTFESIGRPLPNRRNIVITRDKNWGFEGVEVIHSMEDAIEEGQKTGEVFIIGGSEIYKQAMPLTDKLYITHVKKAFPEADSFFPEIIPIVWNEISHEEHKADEENPLDMIFSVYERFI